ncbi:hypothetical protein ABID22_002299 [Pontibacter aydingkolensis]|uniref:Uncharacterized protein n=1 Tax=Pontibacter aydingkolensis TaxID=1911536 RepID=A0ABS7CVR1_9BACT|nr:hypothetical protein [Pontibacter aydingkolensis]MBW7467904.1 hypothetical protein [Pontibacter aydingkolensis]
MSDNKNKNSSQKGNKPDSNANATHVPKDAANTANYKGAVDLGTDGTKATASQQQGQGAWNAKNRDNRSGTESGREKTGQGGENNTGGNK